MIKHSLSIKEKDKKLQGIISILFFTIKEQWINKQKII